MCGLENGAFFGWDLNANQTFVKDDQPGDGITSLFKFKNYIISGDKKGNIQVRNFAD